MGRKQRSPRKLVRAAWDYAEMIRVCEMPESQFGDVYGLKTFHLDHAAPGADFYHFADRGAPVLAVAHLDTVVKPQNRRTWVENTGSGPKVRSGALDDRLGAYTILDVLPKLGILTDLLLTVGEEMGMSTAEHFDPPRDYDWIIEFDRGGDDVVMYEYEDDDLYARVRNTGATVGIGSFSDISYMEHVGCKAMNWGIGYHDYHSERGYAYLGETWASVGRYLMFHEQNKGIRLPHDRRRPGKRDDWSWRMESLSEPWVCECGSTNHIDPAWCWNCGGGRRSVVADYPRGGSCLMCCNEAVSANEYCAACDTCQRCIEVLWDCECADGGLRVTREIDERAERGWQ